MHHIFCGKTTQNYYFKQSCNNDSYGSIDRLIQMDSDNIIITRDVFTLGHNMCVTRTRFLHLLQILPKMAIFQTNGSIK